LILYFGGAEPKARQWQFYTWLQTKLDPKHPANDKLLSRAVVRLLYEYVKTKRMEWETRDHSLNIELDEEKERRVCVALFILLCITPLCSAYRNVFEMIVTKMLSVNMKHGGKQR
jgi:hypothetical protein